MMSCRGLVARQTGLRRLAGVHELVFRLHGAIVGALGAIAAGAAVGATVGEDDGDIEHVDMLPRKQRAFGRDGLHLADGFDVVIEQVIVPVCSTHLESAGAPLGRVIGPVGHDVGKGVVSLPIARSEVFVAFHRVGFREIVP